MGRSDHDKALEVHKRPTASVGVSWRQAEREAAGILGEIADEYEALQERYHTLVAKIQRGGGAMDIGGGSAAGEHGEVSSQTARHGQRAWKGDASGCPCLSSDELFARLKLVTSRQRAGQGTCSGHEDHGCVD